MGGHDPGNRKIEAKVLETEEGLGLQSIGEMSYDTVMMGDFNSCEEHSTGEGGVVRTSATPLVVKLDKYKMKI